MVQLYFSAPNRTVLATDGTRQFVDDWLHAHFVGEYKERKRKQAEAFLERVREEAATRALSKLSPNGELILANAGHNGYSWQGVRGNYTPRDYDDHVIPLERILLGTPIVGDSAHVWVPTMHVEESLPTIPLEEGIPPLLLFDEGCYKEAEYDSKEARFIAKERGKTFHSRELQMTRSLEIQTEYKRGEQQEEKRVVKIIQEEIGYWLGHFEDAMVWYCKKTRLEKLRCNNIIPEIECLIDKSTYASFEEIERVVKELHQKEGDETGKLTRFLLYKAFTATKQGSYIVGQINGSTFSIHMPYVRVALRGEAVN